LKVFGIGLNKTGTTTLGVCLKELGYNTKGYTRNSKKLLRQIVLDGNYRNVNPTVFQYDAFEDWPWPLIWPYLDKQWPGSKFILTLRKTPEEWLESVKMHSKNSTPIPISRKAAYGFYYPFGHESEYIEAYCRHERKVREYFKYRESDLLVINWDEGDGWEELCRFLGCPVPDISLPHANSSGERHKKRSLKLSRSIQIPEFRKIKRRWSNYLLGSSLSSVYLDRLVYRIVHKR
jgi:hypothetical protein